MDEIQYQFDLLKAKNQKLESDVKMYQALVATSTNAFLYYSFEHDKLETMGSWHHFFDFDVHDRKEFELISDAVCEQYRGELRDVLYLETTIIKVKGPIGIGKAVATVNGKKVAEAELSFAIG